MEKAIRLDGKNYFSVDDIPKKVFSFGALIYVYDETDFTWAYLEKLRDCTRREAIKNLMNDYELSAIEASLFVDGIS